MNDEQTSDLRSRAMTDEKNFPLLASSQAPYQADGRSYPRVFSFSDGSCAPLFTSGVVAVEELERIAQVTASRIAERYAGQRLLLVQVLEGARTFTAMVIRHLESMREAYGVDYEVASVQVRSYSQGTQATSLRVLQPLQNHLGRELTECTGFEGVVLVDDLIDAGSTVAWLVREYLPKFIARGAGRGLSSVPLKGGLNRIPAGLGRGLSVCTMLDKERQRDGVVEEVLAECLLSSGLLVPDEWLVGYGLDMALPATGDRPALNLFRQALPGGIYAFNSAIVQQLIAAYETDPAEVHRQLEVYLSPV
jgi:hypoxanthine-guanine phosphoribosyltransferase